MMLEFFNNKKILIVIPHPDDEINVASGLLSLNIDKKNIYVVYTTNGDYSLNATIRYREAISSLRCYGVKKENIFFLGYSDQSYSANTHMYNSNDNWASNRGIIQTYGAYGIKEWCYQKNYLHHLFNKDNFCNDLKEVIVSIKPEIIIGIDLDFHPDHIMTSLLLEKAIGQILREYSDYHPVVLKTFAYENAYFGENDFNFLNQYGMQFFQSSNHLKSNPYYDDSNCLKFSSPYRASCLNLNRNIVFKAIKCHVSQLLVMHAFQILNANNVYWYRCTDNLINNAKIQVSSGDASLLNDFMLCDSKNILHGDKKEIFYDSGIWIPNEKDIDKTIEIKFEKKEYIKCMKIYSGRLSNKKKIEKVRVILDNDVYEYILSDNFINTIEIDKQILEIRIQVLDKQVENGFSEIELLKEEKLLTRIFKVNIDNTWSNNFICSNKKETKYRMNLTSNYSNCFSVRCDNLKKGFVKGRNIFLTKKTTGYIEIYDCFDNYMERIYINKNIILKKVTIFFNKIYIKIAIFSCKIKRKILLLKIKAK